MYDLGIIGGMGPEATTEVFRRIVTYTNADCDQEHINICILNNSRIPDRTNFIIKDGESPLPYLKKSIDELVRLETKVFIMPCNTSHYFAKDLNITTRIRFINMIEETLNYAKEHYENYNICILGTLGTIEGRIYEGYIDGSSQKIYYPVKDDQNEIMNVITSIKGGISQEEALSRITIVMSRISEYIQNCVFILACTELSLYSKRIPRYFETIDAMDILAIRAIKACGYKLKNTFDNLNDIPEE